MLRRAVRGAVIVACCAALGCQKHAPTPSGPPPSPAVLTTVVQAKLEPSLSRRGAVSAGARLRLGFDTPGVLADVTVKTGDAVKKGQLVARLKDGGASAAFQAAQANRQQALRDYGVTSTLAQSGSLPSSQRDQAKSALQVANANAAVAAESIQQRILVSPISGTVVQRLAQAGELVTPGTPVLVIDAQVLVVKVGLTDRELPRVVLSQAASLVGDDGETSVKAKVSSIGPAPLEDGLYAVEVTPVDEDQARKVFRPGTLVTVQFAEATRRSTIRIPLGAVVHRDGQAFAFVAVTAAADTQVSMRQLEVDRIDGSDVLVRGGLADGERIVREGVDFIQDGQNVRVVD